MSFYDILQKRLDKIEAQINDMAISELKSLISKEFLSVFVDRVLDIYRRELVARENPAGKKDPTAPSALEPEFSSYLRANAQRFFTVESNRLMLNKSYLEDLGFPGGPSDKETNGLKLLYFYFAGIIGTYGFISAEDYEDFKGRKYNPKWGRFGEGFFIERGAYISVAKKRSSAPRFSEIVSPLSGRPGVDVIQMAFDESIGDLKLLVKKAVSKAVENYNKGNS